MHSPSALTEHVSLNLAGTFLLDPVFYSILFRYKDENGNELPLRVRLVKSTMTRATQTGDIILGELLFMTSLLKGFNQKKIWCSKGGCVNLVPKFCGRHKWKPCRASGGGRGGRRRGQGVRPHPGGRALRPGAAHRKRPLGSGRRCEICNPLYRIWLSGL